MKTAYFVAGTDTEIGKTYASCALLHAFRTRGQRAVGMKPIAAGVDAAGLNEDVEALIAASSADLAAPISRALVNPYCFADPIAPHIAAEEAGVRIDAETVKHALTELAESTNADIVIVEGVGGFLVPLGTELDAADLAVTLGLPVILVVGMRLGCINHALLTAQGIRARGLPLAGWIANCIDPAMLRLEENLAALQQRLAAPLLGTLPFAPKAAEAAARYLNLPN